MSDRKIKKSKSGGGFEKPRVKNIDIFLTFAM